MRILFIFSIIFLSFCEDKGNFSINFFDQNSLKVVLLPFHHIQLDHHIKAPEITPDRSSDDPSFEAYRQIFQKEAGKGDRILLRRFYRMKHEGESSFETLAVAIYLSSTLVADKKYSVKNNEVKAFLTESGGPPGIWHSKTGEINIKKLNEGYVLTLDMSMEAIYPNTDVFVWQFKNPYAMRITSKGLTVQCALDTNQYEKGMVISDDELATVTIKPNDFHGEWNYTISHN